MKPLEVEKRYLFPDDYMADPSVHIFNGRLYIYPSHDWECENVENDNGDQYVMKDMHVLSIDGDPMTGKVTDHGKA
ncbi:MAG: alpha-N-arabinofuranosidase, partial [Duncaniella sp.]|nr:alpha-N-arabinofuranosidase [Duncaniella sp.]